MTTEQTKNFILAGRAIFTIANGKPAPDTRDYTFKVTRKDPDPLVGLARGNLGRRDPVYFVALLTGSDNETDYSYLGILDPVTGRARPTAKSSHPLTSKPFVALNWALGLLWAGQPLQGGATLQHAGRCGKCARLLTVPESIESGLGPECSGLGYTKPRNERKPRTKKAPKPTFDELRAQAAASFIEAGDLLVSPAKPTVDIDEAEQAALAHDAAVIAAEAIVDTLDLGGLYSNNLAGFYAAAAAEDSVDRAERALGVQ